MILTKDQEKSEGDKKGIQIRKSKCVESDGTHCCTGKFNMAFSLYKVLEVTLYFSKSFSKIAAKGSAVAEAP